MYEKIHIPPVQLPERNEILSEFVSFYKKQSQFT